MAEELSKVYRGGVEALRGVSLKVRSGIIYSLLGRNGAGKTTFLRIMATQLLPTRGDGWVMGYHVVSEPWKVRNHIAVIPQESRPMYLLTVKEHVKYFLVMRGLPIAEASRRASQIIRDLDLEEYSDTLCMRLSGGLRRKVLVAMAMATEADVLFLDEPTTGLDPVARRLVWEVIQRAADSGQTVFMTTHYMEEAETISDEFAMIDGGRLVASGKVKDVAHLLPYKIKAEIALEGVRPEELENYGRVVRFGRRLIIYLESEEDSRRLHDYCISRNLPVSFSPIGLEDLFVEVIKRGEKTS